MMVDKEAQARVDIWKLAFSFVNLKVIQCVMELDIPDVLEKHGGPMTLSQLSSAVGCASPSALYRIMRFLTHQGIFEKTGPSAATTADRLLVCYAQTPLSRLLTKDNMAPLIMLPNTKPHRGISAERLKAGHEDSSFAAEDVWTDQAFGMHSKMFTDGMECHARMMVTAFINNYPNCFKGMGTLTDVGGRHGLALGMLVQSFPGIRGINFDLPKIVSDAPARVGVEHVGGSMFESVPKADAVTLMRILHDWSDELCIDILKKCKEAVPSDTGKVIIVEAVIDEDDEEDEYAGSRLGTDMALMYTTVKGYERTLKEWEHLLNEAGFGRYTVKNIQTIESVIEAYP